MLENLQHVTPSLHVDGFVTSSKKVIAISKVATLTPMFVVSDAFVML